MEEHTDSTTEAADGTFEAAATDDVTRYPIAPGYRVNVRRGRAPSTASSGRCRTE